MTNTIVFFPNDFSILLLRYAEEIIVKTKQRKTSKQDHQDLYFYQFEKYYLKLVLYKFASIFIKVWDNTIGRYFIIFVWFIVSFSFAMVVMFYFFLGVNRTLERFHLEKYRIDRVTFMHSSIDLKPYYAK